MNLKTCIFIDTQLLFI